MKPPVKPDNIPHPPEGFTYAGTEGIAGATEGYSNPDIKAWVDPRHEWVSSVCGTYPPFHYAVRTNSEIHKAQPWYEPVAPKFFPNKSITLFTEEELETELQRRRKPKTITINGIEIEPPVYEIPSAHLGSVYSLELNGAVGLPNGGFEAFPASHPRVHTLLKRGIIHLTKEAAIKHAEALISFTKQP
jgi:hypothetical protein